MSHTIMLMQPTAMPQSRTYSDFETLKECLEALIKIYEEHLKNVRPNSPTVSYDVSELFSFLDQLSDVSCLIFQERTNLYAAHDRDWIKRQIYTLFESMASDAGARKATKENGGFSVKPVTRGSAHQDHHRN